MPKIKPQTPVTHLRIRSIPDIVICDWFEIHETLGPEATFTIYDLTKMFMVVRQQAGRRANALENAGLATRIQSSTIAEHRVTWVLNRLPIYG